MTNEQPARGDAFPILPALILFGVFGALLAVLLSATGDTRVALDQMPHATVRPPTQVVVDPTEVVPTAAPTVEVFVAPGAGIGEPLPTVVAQPVSAEQAYAWACSTCHAVDGSGTAPFGPAITESDLLDPENEADLIAFLTDGTASSNPSTDFPHPPRGGYPPLTDDQIAALAEHVQALAAR